MTCRVLLLAAVWVACSSAPAPSPAPRETQAPTKPAASTTAPSSHQASAAPSSAPSIPAGNPKDFDQQWLVLLSSKAETGFVPENLDRLTPELGAQPVRLSSTQFKKLMPCYEIVVAKAFSERKEAAAFAKSLQERGIEAYAKHAGAYLGEQSQMEAYCQDLRAPSPEGCGELRFVLSRAGLHLLDLKLAPELRDRVLGEKSPALKASDDSFTVWTGPLSAQSIGPYTKGQSLYALSKQGKATSCTIKGFVAGKIGTPHFGYFQDEEGNPRQTPPEVPGCGEERVYASLDCQEKEIVFALPSSAKAPRSYAEDGAVRPALERELQTLLETGAAFDEVKRASQEEARAKGQALTELREYRRFSQGSRTLYLLHTTFQTGEGFIECGGEDLRAEVYGVAVQEKPGGPLSALVLARSLGYVELLSLVDLETDGAIEFVGTGFPDVLQIQRSDGSDACELEIPFCDCGC
jgi:hypothetical protein